MGEKLSVNIYHSITICGKVRHSGITSLIFWMHGITHPIEFTSDCKTSKYFANGLTIATYSSSMRKTSSLQN